MRFETSKKPPPYLNRKDQLRMLGLIATLAVVVIAIRVTAKPEFWSWMFPSQANQQAAGEGKKTTKSGDLDFNVRLQEDPALKPGEFIARPDAALDEDAAAYNGDSPKNAATDTADSTTVIVRKLLAAVEDNTLGIRHSEADAFFSVLKNLQDISQRALQEKAIDDVGYGVLNADPDYFRGRPITIGGEVRRIAKFEAGENPYGIESLFEVWLLTADSGTKPYRIVCLEVPPGMPQAVESKKTVSVRVTGYFFKRQGYEAVHGLDVAPLILAKTLRWPQETKSAAGQDHGLIPYIVGFTIIVAVAIGLTLWRFNVSDRVFQERQMKRIREAPPEAIAALNGIEAAEIDAFLRGPIDDTSAPDTPGASHPNVESESDSIAE